MIGSEAGQRAGSQRVLVQTHGLTKRYGSVTALDDCTLAVRRGEIFGLLGPNGAGKTTLLRLLLGFLRPTSGSATIDSLDCCRRSVKVHRRVAYLPGDVRLFRRWRGHQVLRFFAQIRSGGDERRGRRLAERFELDLSRRVALMSTGMRQKLALAATLSADTPLVVLDEPTSHLDPNVRGDVMNMVGQAKADGRTVIFSSHVLSEVEEVCDRVVILRDGRPAHTQVMSDLRRQHRIRARLTAPLPEVPEYFKGQLSITTGRGDLVTIDTPGELAPLLGWLATLPLADVNIEPVGLRIVYDRCRGDLQHDSHAASDPP